MKTLILEDAAFDALGSGLVELIEAVLYRIEDAQAELSAGHPAWTPENVKRLESYCDFLTTLLHHHWPEKEAEVEHV